MQLYQEKLKKDRNWQNGFKNPQVNGSWKKIILNMKTQMD